MIPFRSYLDNHPGTKNYEVKMLSKNNHVIPLKFFYDTVARTVVLYAVDCYKITNQGETLEILEDVGQNPYENGILESGGNVSEWVIDGKKDFIDIERIPFPAKDPYKELHKLYMESDYYFLQNGYPTFKIKGKWIKFAPPMDLAFSKYLDTKEYEDKYPEKPKGRFINMPKVGPDLGIPPKQRDTSLLKSLGYIPVDVKKESWGLTTHNYSAGFYNMEIYMPGGDTIQFRHFGSLGPDIELFRVPEKYGGRKDILFVAQDYNYLYPDQSVGGVYVIRPRKLK